ncbi:hypothetical protein [Pseudomonas viridiflava]|uniref:hypothetical protein n=1 Tax=Pseudomonas viridiflava TaxID=33069 RepID=UPI0013CED45A|nr:hypothetical protein [Pseudomonas viridiflava]MBI6680981.1 hypothetical protein [Pseudomonas viridiflava]
MSLTKPVAKDLLDFLRRNVSYDMAGLLNANPGSVSVPSQGVDGWGALFTSDRQMAYAKNLKEGWLTPDEMAGLDQWVKEASWIDVQLGRKPDVQERAIFITDFQMAAAMALLGKEPGPKGALPRGQTVAQFEKISFSLPPGERVAQIKSAAASVTVANGLVKNNKLSELNGRDVYGSNDGILYTMDTQHGRFEVINPKNGKHLGRSILSSKK